MNNAQSYCKGEIEYSVYTALKGPLINGITITTVVVVTVEK